MVCSVLACRYIDMGVVLLETCKRETQYSLCLDLYKMTASIATVHRDTAKLSTYLNEILSHVKVFGGSLKALSLLVKSWASSSRFEEAKSKCLMVSSALGEEFPCDIDHHLVQNKLSLMRDLLKNTTIDQLNSLPLMRGNNKLNTMKL